MPAVPSNVSGRNPLQTSEHGFVTESLVRAAKKALLRDTRTGRTYVAISPGYAVPPTERRRVLHCRLFVFFLSFLVTLFASVAQTAPIVTWRDATQNTTVWNYEEAGARAVTRLDDRVGLQAVSVMTAVFGFLLMVLCIVFLGTWGPACEASERADRENAHLQYALARVEESSTAGDVAGSCPFLNTQVLNRSAKIVVPLEREEELRRRDSDRLGMAIFFFFFIAVVCSVLMVILAAAKMPQAFSPNGATKVAAGFPLMLVALVCAVVGLLCVSAATPTRVHFDGPALPRCRLMVVETLNTPMQMNLVRMATEVWSSEA